VGIGTVVEFRILGPLEVVDREPLSLGGRKQQAVLAVLLLHRGEVVAADRLIEAIWAGRPPATAGKTLQVYVSNLRKALGGGLLVTQGRGYMLAVEPHQVDSDRFEKLAANGREALDRGDSTKARTWLVAGLRLWRGPALADFSYESFAQSEIARLDEVRTAALEYRIEADLRLGHHASLVPELEALVHEYPLRERLYEHLMLALYRSGRQVDALERYQRARRKLIDEFGVEPGPRLQEIQRAVLTHDPALDLPGRSPRPELPQREEQGGAGAGQRVAWGITVVVSFLKARASSFRALATRLPGLVSRLLTRPRHALRHASHLRLPPPVPRRFAAGRWLALGAGTMLILVVVVVLLATGGGHSGARAGTQAAVADWARISSPTAGGVYVRGERVATTFSCGGPAGGPRLTACIDSTGNDTAAGGSGQLDTSSIGLHRYWVAVSVKGGAKRTTSITYTVAQPVSASIETPLLTVFHGRTSLPLACSGGVPGLTCRGSLALKIARRKGATFQFQTVASSGYSVPAGATRSIPLSLLAAGQRALGRDRDHELQALATTTLSDGRTAERAIMLKRRRNA
jgi:DNA-binding SARP family transcriptional activator